MSRRSLLVTNDFPPKIGGIQNYLWELWRRFPVGTSSVYTTPHSGSDRFDAAQEYPVRRSREPFLLPYPWLPGRLRRMAMETASDLIVLDPALPLGAVGPSLGLSYAVVVHGAEMTIPGRLPGLASVMRPVLNQASLVVAAGQYPLSEAERCVGHDLPSVVVPPGVDTDRFRPLGREERRRARRRLGVGEEEVLLATVSRLVPRKGMDTLIRAAAEVERRRLDDGNRAGIPPLTVLVGGAGRSARSLESLVGEIGAPVRLLGRLADDEVVELYGAADLMAMLCNERWFGLEQEGFGIVFLEAAACGIPQIAGRSGGAHEAVDDGVTGIIVDHPTDVRAAADAIEALVVDPSRRWEMGLAARRRAESVFDYDLLADRLANALSICR